MAQQDRNLPEGTDTIIPGATETGTSSSSGVGSSGQSGGIMDKVKSGTDKLSEQAGDKARDFVGQGIERSSEALASVGKLIGETASGLDERLGEEYGDYARRAADSIQGTADRLAQKDAEEVIDDTREFIRKSPAVALAGAAIIGFAIARLIKSGLSSASNDGEDDDRTGGRS
jgi:ElaB/YqjD/DUF883 family membrane-anchored ribosome-binding protein